MNQEQITSIVRQILLAGGGFLVGKGYVDVATMTTIAGALAILAGSAWALYTRRDRGLQEAAKATGATVITPAK